MPNPARLARELPPCLLSSMCTFVFELVAVFAASSTRRFRYYNVVPACAAMSPGFDAHNGVKSLCYFLLVAPRFMAVQEGFLTGYRPLGDGRGNTRAADLSRRTVWHARRLETIMATNRRHG
jgi:hypothetical protein